MLDQPLASIAAAGLIDRATVTSLLLDELEAAIRKQFDAGDIGPDAVYRCAADLAKVRERTTLTQVVTP
jgi:hypothetical protein